MTIAVANHTVFTTGAVSARRFGLLKTLVNMAQLYSERRALASLDAAALTDLGISVSDARQEAARPVWDAPLNWHK